MANDFMWRYSLTRCYQRCAVRGPGVPYAVSACELLVAFGRWCAMCAVGAVLLVLGITPSSATHLDGADGRRLRRPILPRDVSAIPRWPAHPEMRAISWRVHL